MTDRRSFVAWLGTLATALERPRAAASSLAPFPSPSPTAPGPIPRALPTALYRQPDGRSNLIRVMVTGLDPPPARARLTHRPGTPVGPPGPRPHGRDAHPPRPG